MSSLIIINVWKKGTNQHTSMPDYHIEVDPGEINYVWDLVSALKKIAEGKDIDKGIEESKSEVRE